MRTAEASSNLTLINDQFADLGATSRKPYADIGPAQVLNMQTFPGRKARKWACPRMRAGESNAGSALDPVMASPQVLAGILGLLFVSALPQVLGVRSGTKQSGLREGGWDGPGPGPSPLPCPSFLGDSGQSGPAAQEPQRPSLQERRERARTGVLPWGALYTAAVVAFVLYKCLQVRAGPGWECSGALRSPGGGDAGAQS